MLPFAVRALTTMSARKKSSGGLTATTSRSRRLVYQAAPTLPITKLAPASTPHWSQLASSRLRKNSTSMPAIAPRPVSVIPPRSPARPRPAPAARSASVPRSAAGPDCTPGPGSAAGPNCTPDRIPRPAELHPDRIPRPARTAHRSRIPRPARTAHRGRVPRLGRASHRGRVPPPGRASRRGRIPRRRRPIPRSGRDPAAGQPRPRDARRRSIDPLRGPWLRGAPGRAGTAGSRPPRGPGRVGPWLGHPVLPPRRCRADDGLAGHATPARCPIWAIDTPGRRGGPRVPERRVMLWSRV